MRVLLLLSFLSGLALAVDEEVSGGRIIQSFEGDGFGDWTTTGEGFGLGPCVDLPAEVNGTAREYCEESFACSAVGGVAAFGELKSPEIILQEPYVSFRLGGSMNGVGLEMWLGDDLLRSATPQGSLTLRRVTWDVREWMGKAVTFRIYDNSEFDFVVADHLVAHVAANPLFPNATRDGTTFEPGLISSPAKPGMLIPEGTTASVFANHEEQNVTSPTALTVAEDGKIYVAETNRFRFGVEDNRDRLFWVMDDIAATTVEDRQRMHEKWQHEVPLESLTAKSEVVRLLQDQDGDGRAEVSTIFADGFDDLLDGTAAGVMAYEGVIYFACIPDIYALSDLDGDGRVGEDERLSLASGFGLRVSLSGHDLNGFALGPDGRIYGTVGDRAMNVTTEEGVNYALTDQGAVFRFDPDGSNFEVIHAGLRNPKEVAFNEVGDAFTVDNNADMGDSARLVYLVEGADSGWRSDHQTLHSFHRQIGLTERPPNRWMDERMWDLANAEQPAWMMPPIAHLSNGPSGLVFAPATALGGLVANQFLLCDYKGGPSASGIHSFAVEPVGASYQMVSAGKFAWGVGATDIDFGYDGTAFLTDFGTGWQSAPQGQVLAFKPDSPHPQAEEVAELMREGFHHRNEAELASLLSHPDMRVRLRAQIALAEKPKALPAFYAELHLRDELLDLPAENLLLPRLDYGDELREDNTPVARLHAVWGLSMLARKNKDPYATAALLGLLQSPDAELRAQAAKGLGEAPVKDPARLIAALRDPSDRVSFFAALSLGRLGTPEAFDPLLNLALHASDANDPYLRHAAVVGLTGCASDQDLLSLSGHALPGMRLPALLALQRKGHVGTNRFLFDHTPAIRHEAIRIIHDTPIEAARPALMTVVDELLEKENSQVPPLIWRRLIHSAFRLAGQENAERLLTIAGTTKVPLPERQEALRLLLQWSNPHPVDQSLGRYVPMRPRPEREIKDLIEKKLTPLLQHDSPVLNAAIALVAHYEVAPSDLQNDELLALIEGPLIPAKARSTALALLERDETFSLTPLLIKILELEDQDRAPVALKLDAIDLLTERKPETSFPFLSQALTHEDPAYRQGAAVRLATHPHPEVPLLLVSYFDRLREQDNPDHTIELEMTLAAKVSAHHAPLDALTAYQESLDDDPLTPYLASLYGGDPERGAALFASHPTAQCARCHTGDARVDGNGMAGPHLAGIGNKSRRSLLESLVLPSATIAPGFAPISLTLNNGESLSGPLLEATDTHIDLMVEGQAWRVLRTDIAEASEPISPMPAMASLLQKEEIRDLVAYLTTLKKMPSRKNPLAQEPKRYHPFSAPNLFEMADETTPTPAPAETASTPAAAQSAPEGIDATVWEMGKTQYNTFCFACHQPDGNGVPGAFPPLAESEWVNGPVENLIRIQLRGLQGEIEVKGVTYNSMMAPMATQTDEQIAAVLTYVRNSFGNSAPAVTPEMVAELRSEEGQPMLTVADLADPNSAPQETTSSEPATAVLGEMPKGQTYMTFPYTPFAIFFVVLVAAATAKLMFGKSQ
ncbi:DUF7133 domain-containing protein [Roseibacillus persicicus]|uniref:Cytochrome c domain-containing protein n=1 Tax=Roseibacillus persicicus TaxID=454148 RepID=A0A918THJ4_9BACT|nr:c-type cytochrome [Roseibacillus persicicus]GHC46313.1 hypothetical protein GCM10007100_09880 [Roseibacillus persicicus]